MSLRLLRLRLGRGDSKGRRRDALLLAEWIDGTPGRTCLSVRVAIDGGVVQGRVSREKVLARAENTSLERDDFFAKLALAYDDDTRGHLFEFQHEVNDNNTELVTKYKTGDGVKVVLLRVFLEARRDPERALREMLGEVNDLTIETEAEAQKLEDEHDQLTQAATRMDDRAETAPKEMDDYLDQIVPQLVAAINRAKQEIQDVVAPGVPLTPVATLRREGSWTRSRTNGLRSSQLDEVAPTQSMASSETVGRATALSPEPTLPASDELGSPGTLEAAGTSTQNAIGVSSPSGKRRSAARAPAPTDATLRLAQQAGGQPAAKRRRRRKRDSAVLQDDDLID